MKDRDIFHEINPYTLLWSTWSHGINIPEGTFIQLLPYYTFHRIFKEKCPLSGAKTRFQYVNPGTFLLH